jgi:hypothetical protein
MSETAIERKRGGNPALLVLGVVVGLVALALLAGGGGVLWADQTQRDPAGYFTTESHRFAAGSYAISHEGVDLKDLPGFMDAGKFAHVRIGGASADGRPIFIGIARQRDVRSYLTGVPHAKLTDFGVDPFKARYQRVGGAETPTAPGSRHFWVASSTGTHPKLTWPVKEGSWSVVVMNADASRGVAADLDLGANLSHLEWIIGGLFALGGVLLAGAALMIALGVRRLGGPSAPATSAERTSAPDAQPEGSYPAALSARLDEPLSRWLWLVKWILLIPHYVVLAFLWIAVVVLTAVSWFSILFTGRYPRALFDFNVGVVRWTWRVAYYGYNALGTDRYPPFSLGEEPDYPARLGIAYPARLSRGLIFVKWLLAIPHLLVVGVLVGGGMWGASHIGDWNGNWDWPGLVGLLTFFAGVALLFNARYPRGLFDLIIGFNRWALRTFAYVGLMTDEYPPFRLDSGGDEPPAVPNAAVPVGSGP